MKAQTKSKLVTYGAAAGIVLSTVLAGTNVGQARNHPAFMPPGVTAPPPSGWLQFCLTYRAICETSPLPAREVVRNEQAWGQLKRINDWVNHNVTPMTDMAHYGIIQWWRYPDDGVGACHSYALLKQRLLIQAGWPRQALLMTVVRDRDGDGHAVLTVKTNKGDYILDNLTDRIRLWSDTGYQFVERQSQSDPNQWVGPADPAAGSGVHDGTPKSENVSVVPKAVEWPTWSSVQVADASDQFNLDSLSDSLVGEVAERIKFARAANAEALAQPNNHTSTPTELTDNNTSAVLPGHKRSTSENSRWAVQLIGDPSESSALAAYRQLQQTYAAVLGSKQPLVVSSNVGINAHWYRVRVAVDDRHTAESLCSDLRAAGGSCLVQRE